MRDTLVDNCMKLGFGLMRLPRIEGTQDIDLEHTKRMVDAFIEAGGKYFDTAYIYEGSEPATKVALCDRYPRESYYLADKLNADYKGKNPILIAILNGAFIFAADLVRHLTFDHEIQFVKYSSYDGMDTTGDVKELIGLSIDIKDRDVIVVEDIIDTGTTMYNVLPKLKEKGVKSVEIAVLLMKPGKLQVPLDVKYCAMEIPNEFIVGYGLDYDGVGRNYKSIYVVKED